MIKSWTQRALACSRIMQAWREFTVRQAILEDPESKPYLQRHHLRLKKTGFATVGHAAARVAKGAVKHETRPSLYRKLSEAREHE